MVSVFALYWYAGEQFRARPFSVELYETAFDHQISLRRLISQKIFPSIGKNEGYICLEWFFYSDRYYKNWGYSIPYKSFASINFLTIYPIASMAIRREFENRHNLPNDDLPDWFLQVIMCINKTARIRAKP